MTGHSVRGTRGFVAKDGEPFDARLNVPIHRYVLIEAGALLSPDESLADFFRAAVREKIARAQRK